jgi:hypothetical protein
MQLDLSFEVAVSKLLVELSKSKSAVSSQFKAGSFDGFVDKVALLGSMAEVSVFERNDISVVDGVGGGSGGGDSGVDGVEGSRYSFGSGGCISEIGPSASLHISGSDTAPSMVLQPPQSPMPYVMDVGYSLKLSRRDIAKATAGVNARSSLVLSWAAANVSKSRQCYLPALEVELPMATTHTRMGAVLLPYVRLLRFLTQLPPALSSIREFDARVVFDRYVV